MAEWPFIKSVFLFTLAKLRVTIEKPSKTVVKVSVAVMRGTPNFNGERREKFLSWESLIAI